MNFSEMPTCDKIRFVQTQLRTAVQNHQVLYVRMLCCAKDPEIENMLRIMQELILSLGRRQTELMYEFKQELRDKFPGVQEADYKALLIKFLGCHDRLEPCKNVNAMKEPNGTAPELEKRAQIVKKKPAILARSGQKMTSLLKVNNVNSASQPRKESERLKAAAATKHSDSTSILNSKKLHASLKLKNDKVSGKQDTSSRRSSVSDEKQSDAEFSDLKSDISLAGYKLTPQDTALSIDDLSQEQFLECFGLIHKDKSKTMVVTQSKRKRRSAAGQSNFYNDYFQPRRPYNRKVLMSNDSPASSQELTIVEDSDKPSIPTSPEDSNSADPLEENTPMTVSPVDSPKLSKEVGNGDDSNEAKESIAVDENVNEGSLKDEKNKNKEYIEKKETGNFEEEDGECDPLLLPLDKPDSPKSSALVQQPRVAKNKDIPTKMEVVQEGLTLVELKKTGSNSDLSSHSSQASEDDDDSSITMTILGKSVVSIKQPSVSPKRDSTSCDYEELAEPKGDKCGTYGAPSPGSASPSDISSIVGVDLGPSTLSSSDCSEMVKRYLDDSQGKSNAASRETKDASNTDESPKIYAVDEDDEESTPIVDLNDTDSQESS